MLIESLESRKLMSASVSQIQSDFAALGADAKNIKTQGTTVLADLVAAIPAGTKGLGPLKKRINQFITDGAAVSATASADLKAVVADAGNPTALATDEAKLLADTKAGRAQLKLDYEAMAAVVTKHPTLTSGASVQGDYSSFVNEWTAFKAEFKIAKADLA